MRRQIFYVNSSQRTSGTSNDFTVNFGSTLRATRGTRTRLALTEAVIRRSWYNIQKDVNDRIIVNENTVLIVPEGFYNTIDLRVAIASILPSGWLITYSRIANKYTITSPATAGINSIFLEKIAPLLGWTEGVTILFPLPMTSRTSPNVADVSTENSLLINSDLTRSPYSVLDNMSLADTFVESSIIAKVPVNAAPNDNITFRASTDLEFIDLPNGHVDTLRLWVTNEDGENIRLTNDWTCTFVAIHEPEESTDMLETVQELRDYVKLMVLSDKSVLQ